MRIFKWTLAFGLWNKPNPQIEAIRAKLAEEESDEEDDEPFEDNSVSGSQQGNGFPARGVSRTKLFCDKWMLNYSIMSM